MLAENRRIEAIQRLRAATGASVAEAKSEMDRIASGEQGPSIHVADPRLVSLLKEGRFIEAIKLHRERTGSGLREAKLQVEALQRTLGIEVRPTDPVLSGAQVVLVILIAAAIPLLIWVLRS